MKRALVVGLGRMGGFHKKVLTDLGYLVSTVDPNVAIGADYPEIPKDTGRFAVAVVASPPTTLAGNASVLQGIPRLYVEKPFALDPNEAEDLRWELGKRGCKVCVGFVERFNPQVQLVRRLVSVGRVRKVRFTRYSDRPTWDLDLDLRLHDIDLARYLDLEHVGVEFDTRAEQHALVRQIDVTLDLGEFSVDITKHRTSPLHKLWQAFLNDGDYPQPSSAVYALRAVLDARQAA